MTIRSPRSENTPSGIRMTFRRKWVLLCAVLVGVCCVGWFVTCAVCTDQRLWLLRQCSMRDVDDLAKSWLDSGQLNDREFILQLCEAARHEKDTEFRRKCLAVISFASDIFPRECEGVCRALLLDDEPYVVYDASRGLRKTPVPGEGHLLLGIWRDDAYPVQSAVVLALERLPDRLNWYARLVQTYDLSSTYTRDLLWRQLRVDGCEVAYKVEGADEDKQWEEVMVWLKSKTPGEWK